MSRSVTVFCGGQIRVEFGRVETARGTIAGRVRSSITDHPIAGVFIGSGFGGSATTEAAGAYRLPDVPLGEDGADRVWRVTAAPPGVEAQHRDVTARAGQDVRADFQFDVVSRRLRLAVDGEGSVTPAAGDAFFSDGAVVDLSATPSEGWRFSHWTGEVADPDAAATTVTMSADRDVTAVFVREAPEPVLRTLTVSRQGNGTVTPEVGAHTFEDGATVELSAVPAGGWRFDRWEVDGAAVDDATTSVTMSADRTATAVFVRLRSLAVAVDGEGSVTPNAGSHTYDDGTEVALTAVPAAGWRFSRWTGGVADAQAASTTVLMDADRAVTAVFVPEGAEPVLRTLTVGRQGQGNVVPDVGTHAFEDGTSVRLSATPSDGWRFDRWTID